MKLTTLLLTAVILHVSATTLAQKVTLAEKDAPLVDVFQHIRSQTGYDFLFTGSDLKNANPVTIDVKNTELKDVLQKIFDGQPLEYSIEDKSVVVSKKEESYIDQLKDKLKAAVASIALHGTVTDETGQAMPGVNVREKGTQNGTITDTKGTFTITVANSDALVDFSFIGYDTKELTPKDLPKGVVITLKVAENNLREVVINKGPYDEKQRLSTGDVSVVSGKTIAQQPVTDPIMALEGQVPGLYIAQASGIPGANETIMLRGQNSLVNGNAPLFIIDGVPFSSNSLTNNNISGSAVGIQTNVSINAGLSPFNALNPDDIESIEVLKDADATAIYGSRGANGVILITTKKGQSGNTKIDANFSQGAGKVTRTMDLMNTQQFLQMVHQAFVNDGIPFPSITTNPSDYNFSVNGVWDTTRNTNWQKVLIGNTDHYSNAQLGISGGTENTQFRISGGFSRLTDVYPGNFEDKKGMINFSLTHSSADKRFQLVFSAGYVNENNNLPQTDLTSAALTLPPDAPLLHTPNGFLNWQYYQGNQTWENPLAYTFMNSDAITNNITSNLTLSYKILTGLTLKSSFGYGDDRLGQTNLSPSTLIYAAPYNISAYSSTDFGTTESSNWIIEPQLSYNRTIYKGLFNVLVGTSFQEMSSHGIGFNTYGYSSDALLVNPANAGSVTIAGDNNSLYRYNAVYARLSYTWEDKYLLNITANRDGSSRFGPDRQWGNFGAAGIGWVFSKESFIADHAGWLSFGKLRASYGITGNDQIGDYQYLSSYSSDSRTYLGNTGLYPTRIPNPYYGWEVNKKLEGGIELGFLKDRINLTASYYRNRSGDQLIGYNLPFITGFGSVQDNLPATVQNSGFEMTLNTVNLKSKDFEWKTGFNLTAPSNKLLAFPNIATSGYQYNYTVGQSIFVSQRFAYAGVNPQTGQYQFRSASGGVTYNPAYNIDIFPTVPITQQLYGGLSNSFRYKSFQLNFMFQFVKQNAINYNSVLGSPGVSYGNEPVAIIGKSWTTPGQVTPYGKLSTMGAADPNADIGFSNFEIGNASFIRLKNLAFSYTLPDSWQRAINMQNVRLYIEGQNLWTITNYFGMDPESGPSGLPPLRMITMGIQASF